MPLNFGFSGGLDAMADGIRPIASGVAGQIGAGAQRSALLQALEQAYFSAQADANQSATARAQAAGTYANTPEFLQGLNDEVNNQAAGAQAALLPRINALRAAEGHPAFNPAEMTQQYTPSQLSQMFPGIDAGSNGYTALDSQTRAALLRELEAAYGGIGQEVGNQFVGQAQGNLGDEDYLRGIQSNVQSGITGAENVMQARINALRSAQGLEAFSDPQTAGQQAGQARNVTQTAAQNATNQTAIAPAATATRSEDAAENVAEDNGENEATTQQNAVTAMGAKKKTPTKVL